MAGIGDWWKKLDPKERTLIAVGVPGVALAAVYSAMRSKKATPSASSDKPPQVVVTGAPTYGDGSSDTFELYRNLTAYLDDLGANGFERTPTPTPTTPTPTVDPCMPGVGFQPTGCSDAQLVQSCINTGGDRRILQELFIRRHTVNDPAFGGSGSPNACGRQYVLYLLEHGGVPA